MSFTYRVNIYAQDGTLNGTYTPSDPLGDFAEIAIDAGGSCGEATFNLLTSAVPVALRDFVEIETSDDGSTFTPLYLGAVVQLPNPRTDDVGGVRCVGLRQRLYEATMLATEVLEGDVAAMFAAALSGLTLPEKVTFASGSAPTLNFTAGTRYPKYESIGAFADALAALVGSFVVPTATTYTYDGVTFNAGDTVPPVVWGVNAAGQLFFRRDVTAAVAVNENDVDTRVDWLPIEAEEFVNRVNVVYATAFDLELFTRVRITGTAGDGEQYTPDPLPIVRTFSAPGVTDETAAVKTVTVPEPLSFMTQSPTLGYDFTGTTWTNPGNMQDNDLSTFGESNAPNGIKFEFQAMTTATTGAGVGFDQGILVIYYASLEDVEFLIDLSTGFINKVVTFDGVLPATGNLTVVEAAALLIATPKEWGFAFDPLPSGLVSTIEIGSSDTFRIYEIKAFRPDVDSTGTRDRAFAESFFTQAKAAASAVRVTGIQPLSGRVTITPLVGGAVNASVERVVYSLTTREGAQTTYYVDQAFPAGEAAERVLLERLARRAVAAGGQS